MNLIAAVDRNWGIGKNGKLLFPDAHRDMMNFRGLTLGGTVIMGGNTARSLPGRLPLGGRKNIVLTRQPAYMFDRMFCVEHDCKDLLHRALRAPLAPIWIIGGEQIYRQFAPYCAAAYITRFDAARDADTHMPDLDAAADWECTSRSEPYEEDNGIMYEHVVYANRRAVRTILAELREHDPCAARMYESGMPQTAPRNRQLTFL